MDERIDWRMNQRIGSEIDDMADELVGESITKL